MNKGVEGKLKADEKSDDPAKKVEKLSIDAEQLGAWQAEFGDALALQLAAGKLTEAGARQEQLKAANAENAKLQAKVDELQKRINQAQLGYPGKLSPGTDVDKGEKEDAVTRLQARLEAAGLG